MEFLLVITSSYLIDSMFVVLVVALIFRFLAHRASKSDQLYYATFTREIEKRVERDDIAKVQLTDINSYIEGLLDEISASLPARGVRMKKSAEQDGSRPRRVSVREYATGNQSLVHSLKSETNAFKTNQKPNFEHLTQRVMAKDDHWVRLHGLFPTDGVIRMIDVLPGIFIVVGIFGTFVGITNALPHIAEIDFNNVSNSSSVLSVFVNDVSFAMRTSIAGIGFSLIISLLNTLYPIGIVRDSIARGVEDCLEYLWYFVHGGKGKPDDAFSRMVILLESIEDKIDGVSEAEVGVAAAGNQQNEAYSKMIHLLENISQKFTAPKGSEGGA